MNGAAKKREHGKVPLRLLKDSQSMKTVDEELFVEADAPLTIPKLIRTCSSPVTSSNETTPRETTLKTFSPGFSRPIFPSLTRCISFSSAFSSPCRYNGTSLAQISFGFLMGVATKSAHINKIERWSSLDGSFSEITASSRSKQIIEEVSSGPSSIDDFYTSNNDISDHFSTTEWKNVPETPVTMSPFQNVSHLPNAIPAELKHQRSRNDQPKVALTPRRTPVKSLTVNGQLSPPKLFTPSATTATLMPNNISRRERYLSRRTNSDQGPQRKNPYYAQQHLWGSNYSPSTNPWAHRKERGASPHSSQSSSTSGNRSHFGSSRPWLMEPHIKRR